MRCARAAENRGPHSRIRWQDHLALFVVGARAGIGRDRAAARIAHRPGPAPAADRVCLASEAWFPASAIAEVIAPHAAWLQRLRYAYGAQPRVFERDIGAVIERYAQCVHLLPATPEGCFRRAGGLLGMGLQIGFYALQAADGAIFSGRETIARRALLEPRWRYATFLAGLCSELHRSLGHLEVTNDRGDEWPAYLHPLALWLRQTGSDRYRVRWLAAGSSQSRRGGDGARRHATIVQYLAEANRVVLPQLLAAVCGTASADATGTLEKLVRRAAMLVIDQDRRADADRPAVEAPVDALRPPPRAQPPALALRAPERLHPAVRAALQEISPPSMRKRCLGPRWSPNRACSCRCRSSRGAASIRPRRCGR